MRRISFRFIISLCVLYLLNCDSARLLQDKEVELIEYFLTYNIPIYFIGNKANLKDEEPNLDEEELDDSLAWACDVGSAITGGIAINNNIVYFGTANGQLYTVTSS